MSFTNQVNTLVLQEFHIDLEEGKVSIGRFPSLIILFLESQLISLNGQTIKIYMLIFKAYFPRQQIVLY